MTHFTSVYVFPARGRRDLAAPIEHKDVTVKLNIFRIQPTDVDTMKSKLLTSGMSIIKQVSQAGWDGWFYYSSDPIPGKIGWAETYASYFGDNSLPKNRNYYAAFVFQKGEQCYVLSYGKSHFYLRPYADFDFGVELAKRIANEDEIKQTASKRFQGKKKKDIKSFGSNARLDIESGESVDYLQAAIIQQHREVFGKSGKFGTSALLSADREPGDLGDFLDQVELVMTEPARFKLPRTTIVTDEGEIARYDQVLVEELRTKVGTTDFTQNSYDLYGVDFVFSSDGTFSLMCPGYPTVEFDDLKVSNVKQYIVDHSLNDFDIPRIKVRHEQEDRPSYTNPLKETLDFVVDDDRVILSGGKWMRFNQDYLDFLDEYVGDIPMLATEDAFRDITMKEGEFNLSAMITDAGYEVADKNFDILTTRAKTPIEAWDLKKDKTVYALKFGTAQKLNYVCDQAIAVLELLRNAAEVKQIPDFDTYCLWLGYRAKNRLDNIKDSGSIILKQKVETWARKCRELGIEPVIKISRHIKEGYEADAESTP